MIGIPCSPALFLAASQGGPGDTGHEIPFVCQAQPRAPPELGAGTAQGQLQQEGAARQRPRELESDTKRDSVEELEEPL